MATHSYAGKRTPVSELIHELLGLGLRSCADFGSHWNEHNVRMHFAKEFRNIPATLQQHVLKKCREKISDLGRTEVDHNEKAYDAYFTLMHNKINEMYTYLKATGEQISKHPMPPIMNGININIEDNELREKARDLALERLTVAGFQDFDGNPLGIQTALKTAGHLIGRPVPGTTEDSRINRIGDPLFWRREIRKALRPWRNLMHIAIAPEKISYACTAAIQEYKSMIKNAEAWSEKIVLVNQSNRECIPMPSPAQSAKNKYAQLVAITKGIEESATARNLTAKIITITLPTEYHPTTTRGGTRVANEFYNSELTPAAGQQELQSRWTRFRAAVKRRKIEWEFVIGCQPHKDETPHWHIVLWTDQWSEIEELIYKYFKMNNNPRQIDIQAAQSAQGASSYAMRMLKYITRQMDSSMTNADAEEAEKASAWASAWGIRRYRTSHCKTTLWKLARNPEVKVPRDLQAVAQNGNYFGFMCLAEQYKCKLEYVLKRGKYGDLYASPKGIQYQLDHTGEIHIAYKYSKWVQENKAEYEEKMQSANAARTVNLKSQGGGAAASSCATCSNSACDPPENFVGPPDPWVDIIQKMRENYL